MTQHTTQAQVPLAPPLPAIYRLLKLYNSEPNTHEQPPERGSDRR